MMAASWVFAYIYQMSYLIATSDVIDGQCYSLAFWASPFAKRAFGFITFLAKYLFPVAIITACYTSMLVSLRRKRNMAGRSQRGADNFQKAQQNLLKTLIIIVACFILCISWNQLLFLFFNLGAFKLDFTIWYYHMTVILYFMNCCVNPVIYIVQYTEFKKATWKLFCRGRVYPAVESSVVTEAHTDKPESSRANGSHV
jgi:hypothetical protein